MRSRPEASEHPSEDETAQLLALARRMAWRWTRSHADADDVAQEAMLRLLQLPRRPDNAGAWLFVVTRRLVHRRGQRDRSRADAEVAYHAGQPSAGPALDLLIDIRQMLVRLNAREQRLFGYLIAGHVSREIALDLGCRERDVGQLVSRARRRAKRLMNGRPS